MEIIEKSREFKASETWKLTRDAGIQKMSDIEGQSFKPVDYCVYTDTNSEGQAQTLLSVMSDEGVVYTTNSETFRREFLDMVKVFKDAGEELEKIMVMGGTTNAGRHFITCALAD